MFSSNKNHTLKKVQWYILCSLALFIPSIVIGANPTKKSIAQQNQTENRVVVKPTIPKVNRENSGKVFLEEADSLIKHDNEDFIILIGKKNKVRFRNGNMFMTCDSAHFYDQINSFNAYGNIHMWQGDTLNVYGDSLNYYGDDEHAVLYAYEGNSVKLINKDVMLETDIFEYDIKQDLGFYTTGGIMTNQENRLESEEGDYSPSTKQSNFYGNVYLQNKSAEGRISEIYSESLHYNTLTQVATIDTDAIIASEGTTINTYNAEYNTNTNIAKLMSLSTITNKDGVITTKNGDYNTATGIANLYEHSIVKTKDNKTLEGDTLFYDRHNGYGEAYGNMIITDIDRNSMIKGDYGYYNEIIDSAFVTGRALALEYSGDTLYMHGDTIRAFRITNEIASSHKDSITATIIDTSHVIVVNPRVRIYRSDIQGVCDSMTFRQKDSLLVMNKYPILWSGNRQLFGDIVEIHFNDSTSDWARLPQFGFAIEHIEENLYNQISGKEMFATFQDERLKTLKISGNVQAIVIPMESDSTYNKIVNIESSFLAARFNENRLEWCKIWPQSNGTVTPLYLAKKSLFLLPKFKWYEKIRPKYPMDVFNVSQEMEELLRSAPASTPMRHSIKR